MFIYIWKLREENFTSTICRTNSWSTLKGVYSHVTSSDLRGKETEYLH